MVQNNFFEEGTILYFTPFLFSDGARPKPKYFLVLKRLSELLGSQFKDEVLLASLPTSKDFVPSTIEKRHGCIDKPEINFNCYYFQEGKSVCVNSFAFPVGTYISVLAMPDREKEEQEQASLLNINDAFKKIIIVGGYHIPRYNNDGVLITGFYDFVLNENIMEKV